MQITTKIFETHANRPNAFFAHHDLSAVGAMLVCKAAGFRVPEDVGIVGFSNWQFCTMLDTNLTSVHQSGFEMGAKATEILLDRIEKKISTEESLHSQWCENHPCVDQKNRFLHS